MSSFEVNDREHLVSREKAQICQHLNLIVITKRIQQHRMGVTTASFCLVFGTKTLTTTTGNGKKFQKFVGGHTIQAKNT